jgi:hypothetical protein
MTNEWAMAEIVRNPRVQCKVQEEVDGMVGFLFILFFILASSAMKL